MPRGQPILLQCNSAEPLDAALPAPCDQVMTLK
jgi:hypothetical protein